MADDIQTERFGESVANESRNQPGANDSPYAPVSTGVPDSSGGTKTGCGCWAYGCAGLLIGSLLLMVGLAFGSYWFVTGQVEKYTDTEPDQIPAVEMEEEEIERLQARIDSFISEVAPDSDQTDEEDQTDPELEDDSEEAGDDVAAPLELVLTANEINALLHSNEDLRGMAHVVIEDGGIQAKVSIPADQVPGGKGRYFNADAEIEVSMPDGKLVIKLVDANVKGEPLPDMIMQPMKEENFAKEIYNDPDAAEFLDRFEVYRSDR